MNTDIRLSTDFWTHPKTAKLTKRAGLKGVRSLQILWIWTARNRPDGMLRGLDGEDVEFAADWRGKKGVFLAAVTELGWLETGEDGGYVIHDWQDHNSWAAESDERGDKARFSRLSRENPEVARHLREQGVTAISKDEYQTYKTAVPTTVPTTVERPYNDRSTSVPTPAPAPAPAPALRIYDSCAEPSQATPPAPEPEPLPPAPAEPALLTFPLSKHGETYPVTQPDIDEWQEAYPGVDVRQELRNCLQWNRDNPTRRKTRSGIRKHISAWLAKAQNRGGTRASPPGDRPAYPQPMTARQRYMQDVAGMINTFEEAKRNGNYDLINFPAPTAATPVDAAVRPTEPTRRALPGGGT